MNQPIITNPTLQFASSSGASSIPLKLEQDTCALCDASDKKARVITTVRPLKPGWAWVASKFKMNEAADGDELFFLTQFMAMYISTISHHLKTNGYIYIQSFAASGLSICWPYDIIILLDGMPSESTNTLGGQICR